jgi:hypothetical protein
MSPKTNRPPERFQVWVEARNRYRLSDAHVQMARELGMNPKKFGGLANERQEPWKLPLPDFIEELYEKRFGRGRPEQVRSIEEMVARHEQKRSESKQRKKARSEDGAGAGKKGGVIPFFALRRLRNVGDWKPVVGKGNWRPGHSAYELARSWQAAGGFPPRVAEVLASSDSPLLEDLRLDHCVVEKPVFLDTMRAPSMTDLMAYCRYRSSERMVIAVEAKATEGFGPVVSDWLRDGAGAHAGTPLKPSRIQRLEYLSFRLGIPLDFDSGLRYQLLHRTVSAVREAELQAGAAMLLVHSFDDSSDRNWSDYQVFVRALGLREPRKDVVQGPIELGTGRVTPTLFAWVSDVRQGEGVG